MQRSRGGAQEGFGRTSHWGREGGREEPKRKSETGPGRGSSGTEAAHRKEKPWEKRSPRPHRPLAALAAAAARRGTPSFGPTGRRRRSGVAPGVEQGVLRGVLRREERLLERSRRKRALFFE